MGSDLSLIYSSNTFKSFNQASGLYLSLLHTIIDDKVYVGVSRGYKDPSKFLKLNTSLYDLKQSTLDLCFRFLEFIQNPANACLSIRPDIIYLVLVDNCLFFVLYFFNFDDMI